MPRQYTPRIEVRCAHCERDFFIVPSSATRRLFCSRVCRAEGHRNALRPPEERFWPRVNKSGPLPDHDPGLSHCWLWTGARDVYGYGTFSFDGRTRLAHVFAYRLFNGPLTPEKPYVTHLCDNGNLGCVRPSHLLADTQSGNLRGAAERGRTMRGERHCHAKLTEAVVIAVRARHANGGVTVRALAREHNVSEATMLDVVYRRTWKHI